MDRMKALYANRKGASSTLDNLSRLTSKGGNMTPEDERQVASGELKQ